MEGCNKSVFSTQRNKLLIIFSNAPIAWKRNPAISLNWGDNYLNEFENETKISSDLIIFSIVFCRLHITFFAILPNCLLPSVCKYNVGCELITAVNLPCLRSHVLEPQCSSLHSRQAVVPFHTLWPNHNTNPAITTSSPQDTDGSLPLIMLFVF